MDTGAKLIDLAKENFGDLSKAERELLEKVLEGEVAYCSASGEEDNDPANAADWPKDRIIRNECIEWLCTDSEASALVSHKGIQVKGARIDGEIDLMFAKILFPLCFDKCAFGQLINLQFAEIPALNLEGTHTGPIMADGLKVTGSVLLRNGFKAEGEIRLLIATIGGNLDCSGNPESGIKGGQFINPEGCALNADGLTVKATVFLNNGFKAEGEVRLLSATIGGSLFCTKGQFINKGKRALSADRLKVNGSVFLRDGFKAEGEVRLLSATIGESLSCAKGQFINKGKRALHGDGLTVKSGVVLRQGFEAQGEVRLLGAIIGGNLDCSGNPESGIKGGQFINPNGYTLNGDGMKVDGAVFLRDGFKAEGEVRFVGATIGTNLECDNGQFINKGKRALSADGLKVSGNVFLRNGFKTEGEVRLPGATIGGNLNCKKGQFINKGKRALNANSLIVEGTVSLSNGFKAQGKVDLVGATIGECFTWTGVDSPEKVPLDLRSARIGTLWDDERSWPQPGKLLLDGLVYKRLNGKAPQGTETRIEWLRLQPKDRFLPQPYEQLADVLRKNGRDADAKKILIAKNEDKSRQPNLTWLEEFWLRQIGPIIGYGYRSWAVCWLMVLFILSGWLLFSIGHCEEQIVPIAENRPEFSGLAYSCDTFFPIVNLYQARYYTPSPNCGPEIMPGTVIEWRTGNVLRFYLWLHIAMGWILTTLLVVGLTGLVRT